MVLESFYLGAHVRPKHNKQNRYKNTINEGKMFDLTQSASSDREQTQNGVGSVLEKQHYVKKYTHNNMNNARRKHFKDTHLMPLQILTYHPIPVRDLYYPLLRPH